MNFLYQHLSWTSTQSSRDTEIFPDIDIFISKNVGGNKVFCKFAPPQKIYALVAELADAPDLGSGVLRREGSSPFRRTLISCLFFFFLLFDISYSVFYVQYLVVNKKYKLSTITITHENEIHLVVYRCHDVTHGERIEKKFDPLLF